MPYILLSLLLTITTSKIWSATVEGMQLSHSNHGTCIVFNIVGNIKYDVFTLIAPDRLVIDFDNSQHTTNLAIPKFKNALINDIRYSMWKKTTLRFVFELNNTIKYNIEELSTDQKYQHNLIINLLHKKKLDIVNDNNKHTSTKTQIEYRIAKLPRTIPMIKTKKPKIRSNIIIAIDAGHGGLDSGALGKGGTKEKDVVLSIAKRLAQLVNNEIGMKAFLIRDKDEFITLRQRIKRAHENSSDMFISIHADSFYNPQARGASVYVLSKHGASSEAAQLLADKENAAYLSGNISLEDKDDLLASILLDLSQTASLEGSIKVANTILYELKRVSHMHRKHVESAEFVVLKSPDIPSLLVETAFISNIDEERKLRSTDYQNKLARALMNGIYSYFKHDLLLNITPIRKHLVQRGDTLISIAQRYQVNLNEIRVKNDLQTTTIRMGDMLFLP
ncbi:MAG: N-acetylmuramoyl-L-alanine amidase [Piscirickettsiaceae bacterium]|nr:N-acetylmuramoyl-L-alanine amidase [Piscirickettsiaceae bacterium]